MSDRYFFDKLPFEQDIFSHLLSNVAQANITAGQRHGTDRGAICEAVDEAIASELRIVMPRMDAVSLRGITVRMPTGLRNPAFGPAWQALRSRAGQHSAVMALPGSIEHAIALASLGLPVALLSSTTMAPIASPTRDVDLLIELFGGRDDIVVGFEPASTPFFYLVSASVRSLRRCVETDPRFSPVRHILTPQAVPMPARPTGTWGVYPKAPFDRIATIVHADNRGGGEPTTVFIGGWMEGGMARDTGFPTLQPMPLRILELIMRRGSLALCLMNIVGP